MLRAFRYTVVFLAIVAVIALAGCQSGDPAGEPVSPAEHEPPPTNVTVLDLPVGQVEVHRVAPFADAVRVDVVAASLGRRAVDLRVWSIDGGRGLSVTVVDPEGHETWDMSFEGDGRTYRITETAGDANLVIHRQWLGAGRWSETYELQENGHLSVLQVDYDATDEEDKARAAREFQAFWPEGTALDNNDEGLLAASIVTSPDVVSRLAADLGGDDPWQASSGAGDKIPSPFEQICMIADSCALAKCWFGGPANHICVVCTSVAMACLLLEMLCSFGWC